MLDWPRAQFYNLFSYLLAQFWWSQSVTPWHLPNEYHCSKLPLSWSPAACWTSSLETLISIWITVYPKPDSPSSVTTHFLRSFHRLCFDNFTVCVAEDKNFAVVLGPSFFQAPHEIHNQCLSWALPSKHTQNMSTSRPPHCSHPGSRRHHRSAGLWRFPQGCLLPLLAHSQSHPLVMCPVVWLSCPSPLCGSEQKPRSCHDPLDLPPSLLLISHSDLIPCQDALFKTCWLPWSSSDLPSMLPPQGLSIAMVATLFLFCLYCRMVLILWTTEYSHVPSNFSASSHSCKEGLLPIVGRNMSSGRVWIDPCSNTWGQEKWEFLEVDFGLPGDLPSVQVVGSVTSWHVTGGDLVALLVHEVDGGTARFLCPSRCSWTPALCPLNVSHDLQVLLHQGSLRSSPS